jgi:acetolactate synthase small subunit
MKVLSRCLGLACVITLADGCSWVKPTDSGARVRVTTAAEVEACTDVGTTHVSVMDKLGVVERNQTKVAEELATLARNSAAELDGDTVVAITEIVDGRQTFAVYQCER